MATHAHTTSTLTSGTGRRSLFAAAPLLALALATPAVAAASNPAASNPDAELLRLGADMRVAGAHFDSLPASVSDEEMDAAHEIVSHLIDQIEDIPARTLNGLLVKAQAIAWCRDGAEWEPEAFGSPRHVSATTDVRLAMSIVRDLAVMQAGGQA